MGRNFNNLEMLPAIGYDGFICANAYQDDGKYIASVTTTPITTGTTGTAVIYPDYLPKAYAGTKCGMDSDSKPSG